MDELQPLQGGVGTSRTGRAKKRIRYLSSEEVEWFHSRILELTGGERGDLAKGNLEFDLERVRSVGEGKNHESAILAKAAFLLRSLVVNHPFINGNKRTAFEVVEVFLRLNGYALQVTKDETYGLLSEIGTGKVSQQQVEDWIARNLAKANPKSRIES